MTNDHGFEVSCTNHTLPDAGKCHVWNLRVLLSECSSAHRAFVGSLVQVEVLEQLPTDLAMEVLRNAPTSLVNQLRQLPSSLRSLAALAHFPVLAASCMLPSECPAAVSGELSLIHI